MGLIQEFEKIYLLGSAAFRNRATTTTGTDEGGMEDIALLSRRWHAVAPSSPLQIPLEHRFPSPALLSTPAVQEEIVQRFGLRTAKESVGELEAKWKGLFLKLMAKSIEEGFALRRAAGHSVDVEDEVRRISRNCSRISNSDRPNSTGNCARNLRSARGIHVDAVKRISFTPSSILLRRSVEIKRENRIHRLNRGWTNDIRGNDGSADVVSRLLLYFASTDSFLRQASEHCSVESPSRDTVDSRSAAFDVEFRCCRLVGASIS